MKAALLSTLLSCATIFSMQAQSNNGQGNLLRHVVMFQFKATASAEDIAKVEAGFRELPSKIPTIKAFEWGINNSPEKINAGLTHCFLVTFASEKDRDEYLPNPAHRAFVKMLEPFIEKAVVIDYWAK